MTVPTMNGITKHAAEITLTVFAVFMGWTAATPWFIPRTGLGFLKAVTREAMLSVRITGHPRKNQPRPKAIAVASSPRTRLVKMISPQKMTEILIDEIPKPKDVFMWNQ
jgi:hypothetical protein